MIHRLDFSDTAKQIRIKQQTVIRIKGDKGIKVGDQLQPVDGTYQALGRQPTLIGDPVTVSSVSKEPLFNITKAEIEMSGYPGMEWFEFMQKFCRANSCKPLIHVYRIAFQYTGEDGQV